MASVGNSSIPAHGRNDMSPERIPALETDVRNLYRRVDDLTKRFEKNEGKQEERHEENYRALNDIKISLHDFKTYFGIGRYLMHVIWGLIGTCAGAVLVNYIKH